MKTLLMGLVASACVMLSGCVIGWDAKFKETRELTAAAGAPASGVSVTSRNGSVKIARVDRADVAITAKLAAQTQERLDATKVVAETKTDGTLAISVAWPEGGALGSEGCSFEIAVPDAHGVTVNTSNGRIEIAGLAGKAHLDTSNGSVSVSGHDGTVWADTSNGSITLKDIEGEVTVDTSNGSITATNIAGPIKADTSNSKVTISLTSDNPGPVVADSSNGSMNVEVGPAFTGTVKFGTSNGRVSLGGAAAKAAGADKIKRNGTITLGKGDGAVSSVTTSNSNITFGVREK